MRILVATVNRFSGAAAVFHDRTLCIDTVTPVDYPLITT